MPVQAVKSKAEYQQLLKDNSKVAVDFWATWCGPCKKIGPDFEAMSNEERYNGVKFLKVDVDELEDVAEEAHITAMPTFLFIENGNVTSTVVGIHTSALRKQLDLMVTPEAGKA